MKNQTLTLSRPIKAHGEEVTSLTFREPDGDDIANFGMPFVIERKKSGGSLIHINTEAVASYTVELCGIPHSSYKQMSPKDIMGAFGVLMGFFGVSETIPGQN